MKTMVLVLFDVKPELELQGVFPSTKEAMEYVWNKTNCATTVTTWPKGKHGDNTVETEVRFKENVALLSLRDTPMSEVAGLGPLKARRVWLEQEGTEGDLEFIVAEFSAADIGTKNTGDLRYCLLEGVMTFCSIKSSLGQKLEEVQMTNLAKDVQATMLKDSEAVLPNYSLTDAWATTRLNETIGHALGPASDEPEELDEFICEGCAVAAVPGAIFPIASNGHTDHPYIEVCDTCRIFELDVQAAKAVSVVFDLPLKLAEDGRPYLEGPTYDEAEQLAKDKQRPMPKTWDREAST